MESSYNRSLCWMKRKITKLSLCISLTSRPRSSSAGQKVFEVPELLEAILFNLSLHDLLVHAPRVSKTWQAMIKASRRLQQPLFFEPIPRQDLHHTFRELSKDSDHATYKLANLAAGEEQPVLSETVLADGIFMNPFIMRHISRGWRHPSSARRHAISRAHASWRSMCVTQPPVEITTLRQIIVKAGNIQLSQNVFMMELMVWDDIWCCYFASAAEFHSFLRNNDCRGKDYQEWREQEEVRVRKKIRNIVRRRHTLRRWRLLWLQDKLHWL